MTRVEVNTDITDERWQTQTADIIELIEKVKNATFDYVAKHVDLPILQASKPLIISICLSDDATVHHLNKEFRNIDRPTNVLTFANMDSDDFSVNDECFPEIDLGSIILAYETMAREAEIENISMYAHFCHLLTHGFLHIIGYDHIEDEEAKQMEGLETAILKTLEIADPYAENEI